MSGEMTSDHPAADRWRDDLLGWGIPDELVAAAGRSPWGHPVGRFAARADADLEHPGGASFDAARDALLAVYDEAEAAGSMARPTVLDVGAGAGAASLPLGPWVASVTAVDKDDAMLLALSERARAHDVDVRTVSGRWPEVADEVGVHDVVVCHHVLFDVPDVAPFLTALTAVASSRVVVEVPVTHPMEWLNPLWLRFHGLVRPTRPTADDLVAVLHELDVRALTVERWQREERDTLSPDERVALVTRRLCLPEEREAEVADAMVELGAQPVVRRLVTLSWAGTA